MDVVNLYFLIWSAFKENKCCINQKTYSKNFYRLHWGFGRLQCLPTGFIQFLFKQLHSFSVKFSFKYDRVFCFIEDGMMKQIRKWSDMSLLKMTVLKTVSSRKLWNSPGIKYGVSTLKFFIDKTIIWVATIL